MSNQIGVVIESGLSDWQIVQQDDAGYGSVSLRGTWVSPDPAVKGVVEVRVVDQNTGVTLSRDLDWTAAETGDDGTWSATVSRIPAGGLYRLETRLNSVERKASDWSTRGDMRHFVGVGDLWVIAGQSNSAGYGRGPYNDPPELGIHLFRNSEEWMLASHPLNESTNTKHIVNREFANPGHSPYLHFARVLKQHLGYPIGLIQTSLGGSPLVAWNPSQYPEAGLYNNMAHCIDLCGGTARGIVWYQGESDASGENATTYATRFDDAVASWREAARNPKLFVTTVQLNKVKAPANRDPGWSIVREAQRQVAKTDSLITVSPASDLSLTDMIHISPSGNLSLGDRMARAALDKCYGFAIDGQAPDIQSATLSASGEEIELTFAPITSILNSLDIFVIPFEVHDADGDVPISAIEYPLNATVKLKLGRTVNGDAVVHGAFGSDPPLLPIDMERILPVLSFYGFPVARA